MAPKDAPSRPQPQPQNDLLARPLYLFDLPEELLYTLTLKDAAPRRLEDSESPQHSPPAEPKQSDDTPASATISPVTTKPSATSCNLCNLQFTNVRDQRDHVRSDLHNYNLKQQLRGQRAVGEAEFEKLIGDLDESISGSESESEDSEEEATDKDSTLVALLKRQAKITGHENGGGPTNGGKKSIVSGSPMVWFQSEKLEKGTSLGVYKVVFTKEEQEEPAHLVDAIRKKQLAPVAGTRRNEKPATDAKGPHYFLCMIGGGHFAAMIVSLAPKVANKHAGKNVERQADVLAHKTFHRYTTRRKQGGAQSASDAARGAAHSAGSSLRRYNETALTTEVRQLLTEWKALIDSAELLFVRATGSANRQTLFGEYEGRVLRQNDPRIRGFPFSTRRATQSELMRAFVELTRVKVSQIDEAALAAAEAAEAKERQRQVQAQVNAQKVAAAKQVSRKQNEEEETAALHTTQIQSLIRRNKAPALLNYLTANNLSPDGLFHPPDAGNNYHAPFPLHLAASLSSPALITALLVKANADPTLENEDGKTAYDLAGDRAARDAFRSARWTIEQTGKTLDWSAAHVPSALSPDEVASRVDAERKEKAAEEKREAEQRKKNLAQLEKDQEAEYVGKKEKKYGKGHTVAEKTGAEKREEEMRGLTPEARMRIERERRARAVEDRLKRMAGN